MYTYFFGWLFQRGPIRTASLRGGVRSRVAEGTTGGDSREQTDQEAAAVSRGSWRLLHPTPPMSSTSCLTPPAPRLRVRLPPLYSSSAAARPSLGFGPRREAPAKVRCSDHSILPACAYWVGKQLNLRPVVHNLPSSVAWMCWILHFTGYIWAPDFHFFMCVLTVYKLELW